MQTLPAILVFLRKREKNVQSDWAVHYNHAILPLWAKPLYKNRVGKCGTLYGLKEWSDKVLIIFNFQDKAI